MSPLRSDSGNVALDGESIGQGSGAAKRKTGFVPQGLALCEKLSARENLKLFGAAARPEIPIFHDSSQAAVLAIIKGMLSQQVMQIVSADMFSGNGMRALTERYEQSGKAHDPELGTFLASLQHFQNHRRAGAAASSAGGLSVPFATREQALSSAPRYNGYAHSFAGMSVQFILFMGVNMGIDILLLRRMGIWNRLLAAPVTLTLVLLAFALLFGSLAIWRFRREQA